MEKIFVALFLTAVLSGAASAARGKRCVRAMAFCTLDGGERIQYDKCTHLCCGGQISDRDVNIGCCGPENTGTVYDKITQTCCNNELTDVVENVECCGGATYGQLYNVDTELCCDFSFAQAVKVHDSATSKGCCGTEPIVRESSNNQCCIDWETGEYQEFDDRFEMCCHGKVGIVPTTAYGECCHDVAYSRNVASCPCQNGILVNVTREFTGCCQHGPNGNVREPYLLETQDCCEGRAYDKDNEFCCGPQGNKIIGSYDTHYCCDETLVNKTEDMDGQSLGCCEIDGTTQTFDATANICCEGVDLFSKNDGDACCGAEPYFGLTQNCCNNTLYDPVENGTGCCFGLPFDAVEYTCCGEGPQGPFQIPACCVDQGFDSYTNTCCGAVVYPNPLMGDDVSHHTRCCGDFSNDITLRPYDYLTQTCCEETIVELNGVSWDNHACCLDEPFDRETQRCCNDSILNVTSNSVQCCGADLFDTEGDLCCNDFRIAKEYNENSQCCNETQIDAAVSICCNGNVVPKGGSESIECCGDNGMDSDINICCDGEIRSLDGVDKEVAVCCGDGCIDGSTYWCCEGKAYYKGANDGVPVTGLNCEEFSAP